MRSSSLLEDQQFRPFSGIYNTYMLPNNDSDPEVRLIRLLAAIKRVYASTFAQSAKNFLELTPCPLTRRGARTRGGAPRKKSQRI